MVHKGIEYEIAMVEPGLWKWQCRIGDQIKTGKTKCSLELLADRRVRLAINRLLRPPRPVRTRSLSLQKLTGSQFAALQATARGEVYRTHTGSAYTLTGPCGSEPLWALARAGLIADPPDAKKQPRYRMLVTPRGMIALKAFVPKRKR
jgi:hypothetical protein